MSEISVGDRVRVVSTIIEDEVVDGEAIAWEGQTGEVIGLSDSGFFAQIGMTLEVLMDDPRIRDPKVPSRGLPMAPEELELIVE